MSQELVIFTDLDGTLLDHETYSFRGAISTLDLLSRRGVPVVPVSSKTAPEIELWMQQLCLAGPYVYENGCGIAVPEGYFSIPLEQAVREGETWRLGLGADIAEVRAMLAELAGKAGFNYRSFAQMSDEELTDRTGLKGAELAMSRQRQHTEPFVITSEHDLNGVREYAREMGLSLTKGGRFHHLARGCDKGRAVKLLTDMFRSSKKIPETVGIGDSHNDLGMLKAVDRAFLVQKPGGEYDADIPPDVARRAGGIGPYGWRRAVEEVLANVTP